MTTVSVPAEQRVILDNVSWATYVRLCDETGPCRGRMAYDQGTLEIMSPSLPHEGVKRLIGRMLEAYTLELGIEIRSVSSTTFQREDLRRGFEADESYYVEHAETVCGKEEIDLTIDPPPDLVIEVDISRNAMRKAGIYRALGVPEVWRHDGESLQVFLRSGDDQYVESAVSRAFPNLPLGELTRFLDLRHTLSETRLIRAFLQWVREHCTS
jgi:Uma2 family endonuclease